MKIFIAIYNSIFLLLALPFVLIVAITNLIAKVIYIITSVLSQAVLIFNPKVADITLTIIESMTVKEQDIVNVHMKMNTKDIASELKQEMESSELTDTVKYHDDSYKTDRKAKPKLKYKRKRKTKTTDK